MQGDAAKAKTAHQDFLTLGKTPTSTSPETSQGRVREAAIAVLLPTIFKTLVRRNGSTIGKPEGNRADVGLILCQIDNADRTTVKATAGGGRRPCAQS